MGGGTPKLINAIEMLYRGGKFYFSLLPLRLFACCPAQIATIFITHGFMQESHPKAVLVFLKKSFLLHPIQDTVETLRPDRPDGEQSCASLPFAADAMVAFFDAEGRPVVCGGEFEPVRGGG